MNERDQLVLLTGAAGEIGRRLLPRLETRGCRVRCLTPDPRPLVDRASPRTEVVCGDVLAPATLTAAMEGVDAAYYLSPHSKGTADHPSESERGAMNFAEAARAAGVRRIICLGLLGDDRHRSLAPQTGQTLRSRGVPVVEFRSSLILGQGSSAFELTRALVERLAVVPCPPWTRTLTQPIDVEDLLAYLLAGLDISSGGGRIFDVGGPERVSYIDLLRMYARLRGLRRMFLRVPVNNERVWRGWLGLVAPACPGAGRDLVETLQTATLIGDPAALSQFPEIRPLGASESLRRAVGGEQPAAGNGRPTKRVQISWTREAAGRLRDVRQQADQWIEQSWVRERRLLSAVSRRRTIGLWRPDFELHERDDCYLATIDLPGVDPGRVDVLAQESRVLVRGHKKTPAIAEGDVLLHAERPAGPFECAIEVALPIDLERVSARAERGVMRIEIPKRAEAVTRRIAVGPAGAP